jgi:DNA repair protein RadC
MTTRRNARYLREAVIQYRRDPNALEIRAVSSSRDVSPIVRTILGDGPQERFCAVALDNKNRIVAHCTLAIGTSDSCTVRPVDVLRFVLLSGCPAFMVAHNHPSGDSTPSHQDVEMTRRLKEAADIIGLRLMDHLVLGSHDYCSMLDNGIGGL